MKIIIAFISLLIFNNLTAHSGRTDSSGGHYNKKTGTYHFHNGNRKAYKKLQKNNTNKYNRKNWKHWIDKNNDCQNERAELLISESLIPVKFKSIKKCVVISGKWQDPYTNKKYSQASDLDIDHIVPLKEAYLSGGNNWSKEFKEKFANDVDNMLVVYKVANRQKSAKDPAKWMPDNKSYHCDYLIRWVNIKKKYNLSYDLNESNFIKNYFRNNCNS